MKTGTTKRTSAAEWSRRVADWARSGLGAAEYGARIEVASARLSWWRWYLRTHPMGPRRREVTRTAGSAAVRLLPVRIKERSAAGGVVGRGRSAGSPGPGARAPALEVAFVGYESPPIAGLPSRATAMGIAVSGGPLPRQECPSITLRAGPLSRLRGNTCRADADSRPRDHSTPPVLGPNLSPRVERSLDRLAHRKSGLRSGVPSTSRPFSAPRWAELSRPARAGLGTSRTVLLLRRSPMRRQKITPRGD